ncbi:cytochrome P450 [Amylocystis lapponica]|nr:cytochrome P450 [Amylocystis lapponica]
MQDTASILYALAAAICGFLLIERWFNPVYLFYPTVGPSAPLLSFIGAFRFIHHAREMLEEGLEKHRDSVFKVAMPDRWMVVVNGPKLIDELRKLPDNQVSFTEAADETLHLRYSLGADAVDDPYHVGTVRNQLTRNLSSILPAVVDEVQIALKEHIPVQGDEWLSVSAWSMMTQIVARASSRVFVGIPKCRDKDYLGIATGFTSEVVRARAIMNLFPAVLLPIVGRVFSFPRKSVRHGIVHFKPIIEERLKQLEQYGDAWTEKPNDMLMWLIEEGHARGNSMEAIVRKIMLLNFAAIHTSSDSITHALYHLAANPEYIQPLREEVEDAVRDGGWTKDSLTKMARLDSFMRESQRVNGINCVSVSRMALQDITLSNGIRIPAGTFVAADAIGAHHNEDKYTDPRVFDPFRFSSIREGSEGTRVQYVNASVDYIPFGIGAHACPGRFFAASELKTILAHIVLNYDVKFEREGERPSNVWLGQTIAPAKDATVLFRRRQAPAN